MTQRDEDILSVRKKLEELIRQEVSFLVCYAVRLRDDGDIETICGVIGGCNQGVREHAGIELRKIVIDLLAGNIKPQKITPKEDYGWREGEGGTKKDE